MAPPEPTEPVPTAPLPGHVLEHLEDLTDYGNAARFLHRWHEDVRWVPEWQAWLIWNGAHWTRDTDDAVWRKAREVVEGMRLEIATAEPARVKALQAHANKSATKGRVDAMLQLVSHEYPICCPAGRLDQHPDLLATPGGTLELREGCARPAARADLLTQCLPVSWDPAADCPRWFTFLTEIFQADDELLRFIHRAVGYTLTGHTSEQRFFFGYGTGANGKSTFLGVLRGLLGPLAVSLPPETVMQGPTNTNGQYALATLRGARGAFLEEIPAGRLHEGVVKAISSGEPMAARHPYERLSTFTPQATLWIAGNHRPSPGDWSEGLARRAQLIPFAVTIPPERRDPDLSTALRAELTGILRWAVLGAWTWYRQRNAVPPAAVTAAVETWRADTDVLGRFLTECCTVEPDAETPTQIIYEAWQTWAKRGDEHPMSLTTFGRRLTERGFPPVHRRTGNVRPTLHLLGTLPF